MPPIADHVALSLAALRLLLLPDSKTGATSVFLPEHALGLLHAQPWEHAVEEFVFPRGGGKPGRPIISIRKPWERLCQMARIEAVRLHDLWHNFASVGAANGLSLPVIGALLGHSQPATTARYAHLAASPLHQAVETIGAQDLGGDERRASESRESAARGEKREVEDGELFRDGVELRGVSSGARHGELP